MSEKVEHPKKTLVAMNFDSDSTSFNSLQGEIEKLGVIEIIDYPHYKEKKRADVTGQLGNDLYVIQALEGTYEVGANTLGKLSIKLKTDIQIAEDKAIKFYSSKHFVKLRTAIKRQKELLA